MEEVDKQLALRMITLFSGAVKGMAFYPESHPAIRQPLLELDKLFGAALARSTDLTWGVIDGVMFFGKHLFIAPTTAIADLTNRMMEKEIDRIVIKNGLAFDELQGFVRLLSGKSAGFDDLSARMHQKGIHNILVVRQEGAPLPEQPEENGDENGDGYALATYGQALGAIRGICLDIEQGRIPSSAAVIGVVDRLAGITMREPSALLGLAMIKDYDHYTFNHCVNVGVLAMSLGASLGMDTEDVKEVGIAGQLHDIGKTLIPKEILNKPGKLSSAEFHEMKRHSELGAKIIQEMDGISPRIAQAVLGHHLHYNRSGYPEWARRFDYNRTADIIAIADTYDAITTLRVYQHPVTPHAALAVLQKLGGTILDGGLVARFMEMMGKYPVGTLVRLDNNEVALVQRPNPLDEEAPVVRIVLEQDGARLPLPREQRLVERDGSSYARIVAVVDPLLKNIDVGRLINRGHY
ncbi:HD-GYP domain-containing protein [Geobacter sp. AOG2]|uniref:HD-GYP domain-containing protein n=1 Tax=Geobacter sp. AOG2 TaxID=1566347 RepID=UPI001CC5476F|nr:HD domain-containing phosphohydrolase [Geobacter sp. AOG2]GFE62057.1 cyclic diguanylate phosphodiesterase [Geobacter sp. AOG2]